MDRKPPAKAMMERLAPNTAALDTPRVEGDAMALFKVVCIIRPETARPAPAIMAASTRGMRMFQRMRILALLPFFKRAAKQSPTDIWEEPTHRHTRAMAITSRASRMRTACFPVFRFLYSAIVILPYHSPDILYSAVFYHSFPGT